MTKKEDHLVFFFKAAISRHGGDSVAAHFVSRSLRVRFY